MLVVRITTTYKYDTLPSVIPLPEGEGFSGYVRCGDIELLYRNDDTYQVVGSLSPMLWGLLMLDYGRVLACKRPTLKL